MCLYTFKKYAFIPASFHPFLIITTGFVLTYFLNTILLKDVKLVKKHTVKITSNSTFRENKVSEILFKWLQDIKQNLEISWMSHMEKNVRYIFLFLESIQKCVQKRWIGLNRIADKWLNDTVGKNVLVKTLQSAIKLLRVVINFVAWMFRR